MEDNIKPIVSDSGKLKQWLLDNNIPFYYHEYVEMPKFFFRDQKIWVDSHTDNPFYILYKDVEIHIELFTEGEWFPDTIMYIPNRKKS